ncbi:hypothetical protein RND81_08G099600 [Saponaria officinalis]|uniref:RING-type E3 ubiquitin transferase n=1 Tax=Saponaria officinalis TaxID=3572 RepID=A0AAW1J6M8_SAPOF
MEFITSNHNFIEELGEEMLLIAMNLYIQQQDDYLRNSSILIDELDREMLLLISINSIRQEEYLNNNINGNHMEEVRKQMIGKRLPTKTRVQGGEDTDVCSICLDEFKEGSCVGVLDCSHEFHSECVKNWLVINNVCPLCKATGLRFD